MVGDFSEVQVNEFPNWEAERKRSKHMIPSEMTNSLDFVVQNIEHLGRKQLTDCFTLSNSLIIHHSRI